MAKTNEKYLKIGAGIAGGLGLVQVMRLTNFARQLTIQQEVSFSRGDIRVTPIIKNPTSTRLVIRQPFVRLFYKNQLVAASSPSNVALTINPASEVRANQIVLPLNYVDLLTKAPDFLKDYSSGKGITLQLHKHTAVRMFGLFWQDVHTVENIKIGGK